MMSTDLFFKIASSVDCVVFGFDEDGLKVLLIKRGAEPYKGEWALPGDLVYPDEDLDASAERVLNELTGLKDVYLEQVKTFGKVDRHPLGRVLTVAYYSLLKISNYNVDASSWAEEFDWHNAYDINDLAFDHVEILTACLDRLRKRVQTRPVGFELLPEKFTLSELQYLYECILGFDIDKRNFRKKFLSMNLLIELEEIQRGVAHRPAKLYKFNAEKYNQLEGKGVSFDLGFSKKKKQG